MRRLASLPLLLLFVAALSACQTTATRRIAVMDFENNTGEKNYQFLSSAVPEFITAQVVNSGRIQVLERQDIQRYLADVDFDMQDMRRVSRWQTLGRRIGADYLVAGSVARLQNNFILTARIFDVERGRVVPDSAIVGTCLFEAQIFERARSMAEQILDRLAAPAAPATAPEPPPTMPEPKAPEAPPLSETGGGGEI